MCDADSLYEDRFMEYDDSLEQYDFDDPFFWGWGYEDENEDEG